MNDNKFNILNGIYDRLLNDRKEEIKKFKKERSDKENDNKIHYHKLNELDKQIKQIEQLLKNCNDDFNCLEVLDVQEKERQRIAIDLHDSSVQNLTHLVHMIELSSMFIDQDTIKAKLELENCIKILKSTIDEMREIIFNLRPMSIDDLGFKQCIENFVTTSQAQFKNCCIEYNVCDLIENRWKHKDKQEINLLLITVYRIIQEAIVNALQHSDADKIVLDVDIKDNKLHINISDNGKGFMLDDVTNQNNKHFGLFIMKERVSLLHGNILIDTDLEKGTDIKIKIPLE